MVDPDGMPLRSKRNIPRRTPPLPSVPASIDVLPPALLVGLPLLIEVSATTERVAVSARVLNAPDNAAR
jgi:hypothetical protein